MRLSGLHQVSEFLKFKPGLVGGHHYQLIHIIYRILPQRIILK